MSPVSTPRDVKPVQAKAKEKTKLYGVDTECIGFHLLPASRRAELAYLLKEWLISLCLTKARREKTTQS